MRGRCARCATSVYGSEASGCRARATSSATASTSSSSARPSRQTHALLRRTQRARRNAALPERPRRARIPPTACSCEVPMVASVFVRIPVQGGEGCSMATRARTAHRSGNREASARTRCARMACRVQWRASVSWRCLKTLGTHSALMPATCRDANEAQESNVRIQ